MAFMKQPIQDFWRKKNNVFAVSYPSRVMCRERFRTILWNVHPSDPEADKENDQKKGTPDHDKLFRVKPLLDDLRTACRAYYVPEQALSVDESMVPTKAKTGMTQYMKDKPIKWGMKLFVLAEARTGYQVAFDVYSGKASTPSVHGLSYDAVMNLVTAANLGTGYHIYMDNFYTSPTLLKALVEKKYGACGTYRENRLGCPKDRANPLPRNATRGEMRWLREGPLLFVKWMDRKEINVLSTIHKAGYDGCVDRKEKNPYRVVSIPCPASVKAYNQSMGGVDLADQLIQYHSSHRKVAKWYKTLFLHFVDIAATNSFIIHKELAQERSTVPKEHRAFLMELVTGLCGVEATAVPRQRFFNHLPMAICESINPPNNGKRCCVVCDPRIKAEWARKSFTAATTSTTSFTATTTASTSSAAAATTTTIHPRNHPGHHHCNNVNVQC